VWSKKLNTMQKKLFQKQHHFYEIWDSQNIWDRVRVEQLSLTCVGLNVSTESINDLLVRKS
jgi:hypothetical protein